ncbi:hypothetical protein HDU96_008825 [Phlyctochytrium bullatum]|nr:hypothetical protein HDU96_008825 [Phlyctochytrium bullatum]
MKSYEKELPPIVADEGPLFEAVGSPRPSHDAEPAAPMVPGSAAIPLAEKSASNMFTLSYPPRRGDTEQRWPRVEPTPPEDAGSSMKKLDGVFKVAQPVPPTRGKSLRAGLDMSMQAGGMGAESKARANISNLSPAEVGERLLQMGIGPGLVAALEENHVDGSRLLVLSDVDLVAMGIMERYSRTLLLNTAGYILASEEERVEQSTASGAGELPLYVK